jgi:preprotein translocase subunit SecG
MILADIPLWLNISIKLLLVLQVVVSILLVGIVMMQRPKQEGLGAAFGAGMTDQMFGARTTSVLQRGTVYLAVAFFALALALAILIGQRSQASGGLLSDKPAEAPAPAAAPAPPVPTDPSPSTGSLSEEIQKIEDAGAAQQPAPAPVEPAAPVEVTPPPVEPAAPVEVTPPPVEPAAPVEPGAGQ